MEIFIEDPSKIKEDDIMAACRRVTISGKAVPVFCGSSLKNKGRASLDAVVRYLPNPSDLPALLAKTADDKEQEVVKEKTFDASFSALVFKIASDPFLDQLCYMRVYSGK